MRWQRAARWLVATAGVATAVGLYLQTRDRPAADRPTAATPADPEAISQSAEGKLERFRDGQVVFSLEWSAIRQYDEPVRTVYERARFRLDDGTALAADRIVATGEGQDGQPADMTLTGNVQLDTPDRVSVRTSEATYTSATGVAILSGPLAFTRGRLAGRGTNGEYHRDTGVFNVLADAQVEAAADPSGGPVQASARSMTFNRTGLALLFDQDARIAYEKQVMTADRATLYLTEDQEQFRVIELRGRSTVVPLPGAEATVPEMRARDIDLAFHEGTQLLERAVLVGGSTVVSVEGQARRSIEATDVTVATAADGRTVTELSARERVVVRTPAQGTTPARTITAASLDGRGNDRGLTDATFRGGVRFAETTAATAGRAAEERVGTSQVLTMTLGGELDAVESAQFQQNVEFHAGQVAGGADVGDYAASSGRLTLRPGRPASRLPRVVSGRVTVDARESIEVDLNTRNLHARGDVKTVSTPDSAGAQAAGRAGGLFSTGEVMFGFATEFWYDEALGRVRYRGAATTPARVAQGDTEVTAQTIDLSEQTRDLTATGTVDTRFVAADRPSGAGKPAGRYRVEAANLEYRDKARTATYTGRPVVLTAPEGTTRSQTMVMILAAEGSGVERLDARTEVHATLPQGRAALADSLLYEGPLDRYTLRGVRGRTLVLRTEGDRAGTCSESRGMMVYFTSGQPPVFPPAENPGRVVRTDVPCTAPLQP